MSRRRNRTWTPRERATMKVRNSTFILSLVAECDMSLYHEIEEEAADIIAEKGVDKPSWMYCDPPHRHLEFAVLVAKQQIDSPEHWVPSEENPNILVIPKHPNATRRII